MARAVRKVSRASTKNQKKETKLSKNAVIAIIVTIALIVIGLSVGLGLYFGLKADDDYVSDKIYFTDPVLTTDGKEVTFVKENYQTLKRYIDEDKVEHMFVFAYDGSAFYADEKDEDHYNKDYTTLITRLADLQYEINEAKQRGVNIELFIVDVDVDSSVNEGILSDELFGALCSESQDTYTPVFCYNQEGEYKSTVTIQQDGSSRERTISTSMMVEIISTTIPNSILYIDGLTA
ncbi:MAG TPA: hypothetical protein IAD46_05365 [Candidatus Pelethenecus faecipullorum]|uniref:Uncharacterized protein n=1 Tax=Candidatus Pelethenecus faecipullorum TaxID=2840900 RepID=A0A9D1GS62_9MOLU|nr:hypothetical protein [Candidatus Pelethenecus faecipullorum]